MQNRIKNLLKNAVYIAPMFALLIDCGSAISQTSENVTKPVIAFKLSDKQSSQKCNVKIIIDGSYDEDVELSAPEYSVNLTLPAANYENKQLKWEGKIKFRGLGTVLGCNGSGVIALGDNAKVFTGDENSKKDNLIKTATPSEPEIVALNGIKEEQFSINLVVPKNSSRFDVVQNLDGSLKYSSKDNRREMDVTFCGFSIEEFRSFFGEPQNKTLVGAIKRDSELYAYISSFVVHKIKILTNFNGKFNTKDGGEFCHQLQGSRTDVYVVPTVLFNRGSSVNIQRLWESSWNDKFYNIATIDSSSYLPGYITMKKEQIREQAASQNKDSEIRKLVATTEGQYIVFTYEDLIIDNMKKAYASKKDMLNGKVPYKLRSCVLASDNDDETKFRTRLATLVSMSLKKNLESSKNISDIITVVHVDPNKSASVDDIFNKIQTHECDLVALPSINARVLLAATDRLKVNSSKMSGSKDEFMEAYATLKGFANKDELILADGIGASFSDIKSLKQFGIKDAASYQKLLGRIQQDRYSEANSISGVIQYLNDEQVGLKTNTTALQVKNSRERVEAQKRELESKAFQQAQADYAKSNPYIAVLSCGMAGINPHINILACFSGRPDTELYISKNGNGTEIFKAYQIAQNQSLGQEKPDGFYIDLPKTFSIRAQNSHDNLTLGLKIIDRVSGKVLYQNQVARFGVVSAKN